MSAVAERNCADAIHCLHVERALVNRARSIVNFICCHCGVLQERPQRTTEEPVPPEHGPLWPGTL